MLMLFALAFISGCDKPLPTELVSVDNGISDELEIELIAQDTEDELYHNGFDTTGIAHNPTAYSNFITASGVKTSGLLQPIHASIATAIFFDKSNPIHTPGGRLLGFVTRTPGVVRFNNHQAQRVPYVISFRDHGMVRDTTLGMRYVLSFRNGNPHNQFEFEYGSSVNFKLEPLIGTAVEFQIPTPQEITGSVTLSGSRENKNLRARLNWNKADTAGIEIIIGVLDKRKNASLPLYRIRTRDDGELIVPFRLLAEIPKDKFSRLIFTFIRKFEFNRTGGNVEYHILSQSLHTIFVDIP
jgi:hypothetical protein